MAEGDDIVPSMHIEVGSEYTIWTHSTLSRRSFTGCFERLVYASPCLQRKHVSLA
jgi:hypothetical protein